MRLLHGFLGVLGGLLVGTLAAVTYPGPLDMPIVGLLIATILVTSGAWFLLEWGQRAAWVGYAAGVIAATLWLLMAPPDTDTVMSVYRWASQTWLVLGPVAALFPILIVRKPKHANRGY